MKKLLLTLEPVTKRQKNYARNVNFILCCVCLRPHFPVGEPRFHVGLLIKWQKSTNEGKENEQKIQAKLFMSRFVKRKNVFLFNHKAKSNFYQSIFFSGSRIPNQISSSFILVLSPVKSFLQKKSSVVKSFSSKNWILGENFQWSFEKSCFRLRLLKLDLLRQRKETKAERQRKKIEKEENKDKKGKGFEEKF